MGAEKLGAVGRALPTVLQKEWKAYPVRIAQVQWVVVLPTARESFVLL